jgi:hypothetical protein
LVSSGYVAFASVDEPTHVHLSHSNVTGQTWVMWVTNSGTGSHQVRWGFQPDQLNNSSTAVSKTYAITDLCSGRANSTDYFVDPGFQHLACACARCCHIFWFPGTLLVHAVMVTAIDYGSIAPTTVYYMVGSSTANQWSQVFVSHGLLRLRFFAFLCCD